jgi:hypothetical protein
MIKKKVKLLPVNRILIKHEKRIAKLEALALPIKIKKEMMVCSHCKKQMIMALVCPCSEIIQALEYCGFLYRF